MAVVQCGECGQKYKAGDHLAGKAILCKACGAKVRIPGAGAEDLGDEPRDPWDEPGAMAPSILASARLPSAPSPARRTATSAKKASSGGVPLWVWAAGGSAVVVLLICGGIIFAIVGLVRKAADAVAGSAGVTVSTAASLADARRAHQTRLLSPGPSPQQYYPEDVPLDAERVTFRSGDYELFGYFAKPEGEGPFPAVLHAHGGMAFGSADFDDASPLLDAGYAIFIPAWRGENGNPGSYETCYGEVHDAEAALEYLASRPDVDPNRLYATGHSIGGTIVMLLAEISPRLKGAMACGGCPDMQALIEMTGGPLFGETFDSSNPLEGDLRSPTRHIKDLKCPLLLCYATEGDGPYVFQAQKMTTKANELGKQVTLEMIPGDHYTALGPAIEKSITFFDSLR